MKDKLSFIASSFMTKLNIGVDENIYRQAFKMELDKKNIKYQDNIILDNNYDNVKLGEISVDFLIDKKVIVQISANNKLSGPNFNKINRIKELLNINNAYIVHINSVMWEIREA